jgi:ABC-type uncharacterized transport system permease subunit
VLFENVPSLVQRQSLEEAKKWAAEWNMSVEEVLASQDERFPKAVVAPKPKFVMGGPLVSDTSQTHLYFLMLHACLYTICFVFCYTLWCFYAFSGTNLLTRRHSVSSLFSAIFVFRKSYIGNILGIGRNKSRTSYFY